jgi:hypothetical protein
MITTRYVQLKERLYTPPEILKQAIALYHAILEEQRIQHNLYHRLPTCQKETEHAKT